MYLVVCIGCPLLYCLGFGYYFNEDQFKNFIIRIKSSQIRYFIFLLTRIVTPPPFYKYVFLRLSYSLEL